MKGLKTPSWIQKPHKDYNYKRELNRVRSSNRSGKASQVFGRGEGAGVACGPRDQEVSKPVIVKKVFFLAETRTMSSNMELKNQQVSMRFIQIEQVFIRFAGSCQNCNHVS